jgi:hypothetical protein
MSGFGCQASGKRYILFNWFDWFNLFYLLKRTN